MGIDTGLTTLRIGKPVSRLERETGIEPASLAWKARVLPLNYSRANFVAEALRHHSPSDLFCLVEEAGFEPA